MKETGLMFKAPLVRAILDGSKIQTRRVFSEHMVKQMRAAAAMGEVSHFLDEGRLQPNDLAYVQQFSPVGQPGDRIYVRERFAQHPRFADLAYRAEGEEFEDSDGSLWIPKWAPAIHMPRKLARIWLEITGVRVERLQSISRGDAMAEGCPFPNMAEGADPREWFAEVWQSTVGEWAATPLGMGDRLQAHRETAMTSASTVGLPEDKAYIAHHFNCPTCCAAGLSGGKQARCPAGQRLWDLYLQAFQALNLTPK